MARDAIELKGTITDTLKGGNFKVKLEDNGLEITCTLSGKLRKNNIRVITGDVVDVEMSPYDLTKGRISWRYK